jgi:hypothetical protein
VPIIDYGGLVDAFVARRRAPGWTQLEVDAKAGFSDGYCGKLEAWSAPSGRVAGALTLPLWWQTLGLTLMPALTVSGTLAEQRTQLEAITRPRLNGAEMQRRPRRGR